MENMHVKKFDKFNLKNIMTTEKLQDLSKLGEVLRFKLETTDFGKIGVGSAGQAYIILTKIYPKIANKELAKEHIFRICKSYDEETPFNLTDNKRSFAIGGFGPPVYITISEI